MGETVPFLRLNVCPARSQSLPGRELRNAERRRAVSSFFNAVLRRSVVVSAGYWRCVLARFAQTTVRGLRRLRITRNPGYSNLTLLRINRWEPDRAAGEVELVYGKNAKWILFNPNRV